MKKLSILILSICFCFIVNGQENKNEEIHGFRRDRLFLGGSLGLGFGTLSTNIGGNPEIGYSLSDWLDAGIAFNINYLSVKADPAYNGNVRTRSFTYGGGPYIRFYPVKTFFIQGQAELNNIKISEKSFYTNTEYSYRANPSSLLVGIGYAQRIVGQSNFYTLIMMDVSKDKSSPYVLSDGSAIPIIRAGFNFYLRPKTQK